MAIVLTTARKDRLPKVCLHPLTICPLTPAVIAFLAEDRLDTIEFR